MPAAVDDKPYSAGDLVHIWISDLAGPDVATAIDAHIDANGKIPLPLVKDVHIAGLTQDKARKAINRAYHDANLINCAGAQIRKVKAAGPGTITAGPIEVGDVLKIRLWDLDGPGQETAKELEVKDEGTISLPKIGPITVIGMTEGQVAHAISKEYRDASLIQNMQVTVLRTATMAGN
jgi:protein involved in polysaccharide export with SLBB domain